MSQTRPLSKTSGFRFTELPLRLCALLGETFLKRFWSVASIFAILWGVVAVAIKPQTWTKPVRSVFARQLLFTGVDGMFVAVRFGAAVGVLMIVQVVMWIDAIGITTDVIAPLLWRAIVREIAPLLACLVVIGRSGIAISTELATMVVNDEIEVLDSQGMDPMAYLVMPRVASFIISTFCLAVVTALTMLITGYVVGWFVDAIRVSWWEFSEEILREFSSLDLLFFIPKTIIAGGFAGAICCIDGLSVRGTMSAVPRVSSRSGIRALTAVILVSAILSILIYGRILIFKIG